MQGDVSPDVNSFGSGLKHLEWVGSTGTKTQMAVQDHEKSTWKNKNVFNGPRRIYFRGPRLWYLIKYKIIVLDKIYTGVWI